MHLKKTKKTPRMIRIIALMLNARDLGHLPPAPPFWKSWWLPALWSARKAKKPSI